MIIAENQCLENGIDKLINNTIPLYFTERTPTVPSSITFPIDELTNKFFPWAVKIGHNKYDDWYWTSSAQMMIALAIYEKYDEIELYGINMADNVEYRNQRKGCEYVIGFGVALGIKIRRPLDCPILRARFAYGYDIIEERAYRAFLKERKNFLTNQINQLKQTGSNAALVCSQYEGHLSEVDLLEKNWLNE